MSDADPANGWIVRCEACGIPLNAARRAMLDALSTAARPLDAPALYRRVQSAGTRISLGTVYRFLAALARAGLVEALPTPGRTPARLHASWRGIAPVQTPDTAPRDVSDNRRIAALLLDDPPCMRRNEAPALSGHDRERRITDDGREQVALNF